MSHKVAKIQKGQRDERVVLFTRKYSHFRMLEELGDYNEPVSIEELENAIARLLTGQTIN